MFQFVLRIRAFSKRGSYFTVVHSYHGSREIPVSQSTVYDFPLKRFALRKQLLSYYFYTIQDMRTRVIIKGKKNVPRVHVNTRVRFVRGSRSRKFSADRPCCAEDHLDIFERFYERPSPRSRSRGNICLNSSVYSLHKLLIDHQTSLPTHSLANQRPQTSRGPRRKRVTQWIHSTKA
jgi:hypothetical protein